MFRSFPTARKKRIIFLPAHLILNISFSSCCRTEIAASINNNAAFLKRLRNSRKKKCYLLRFKKKLINKYIFISDTVYYSHTLKRVNTLQF